MVQNAFDQSDCRIFQIPMSQEIIKVIKKIINKEIIMNYKVIFFARDKTFIVPTNWFKLFAWSGHSHTGKPNFGLGQSDSRDFKTLFQ